VPLALGHISGDDHYYIVNDHIQIATSIYIGGGVLDYKAVPFENLSNDRIARNLCDVNSDFDGGFTTGSKGKLSLYINHPFVGELIILW
jgi:hypothetical protein